MLCSLSRTYINYEEIPSVMTRVLNGLCDIGYTNAVNTILRKFGYAILYSYETAEINGELRANIVKQITADLYYTPKIAVYDYMRILMIFTMEEFSHGDTIHERLSNLDLECGFKGGTLGDYPIPLILKTPYWAEYIQTPMSVCDLTCIDGQYLDIPLFTDI